MDDDDAYEYDHEYAGAAEPTEPSPDEIPAKPTKKPAGFFVCETTRAVAEGEELLTEYASASAPESGATTARSKAHQRRMHLLLQYGVDIGVGSENGRGSGNAGCGGGDSGRCLADERRAQGVQGTQGPQKTQQLELEQEQKRQQLARGCIDLLRQALMMLQLTQSQHRSVTRCG